MTIIDVRSPSEYETGHKVGAINVPLFSDAQRAEVGTLYKQVSREKAIERGLEFVGPKMADIVRTVRKLANAEHAPIELYCARGGMRSASVAWLLRTAGLSVDVIKGGYKAYRADFERSLSTDPWRLVVINGATGSGKTDLLQYMEARGAQILDLEGLANHRGSAFGGVGQGAQPTTEQFINLLHDRFEHFAIDRPIFCEGESMLIGHVYLPRALYDLMQSSEQINVVADREDRLERIVAQYGALPSSDLKNCFLKIAKRMGPDQTRQAIEAIDASQISIAAGLGLDYYDKCYKKAAKQAETFVVELSKETMAKSAQILIERYEKNS